MSGIALTRNMIEVAKYNMVKDMHASLRVYSSLLSLPHYSILLVHKLRSFTCPAIIELLQRFSFAIA